MKFKRWNKTKLEEIVEINPKTSLKKGTVAKKVAMEHVKEFTRKISGFEETEFKSGSKFINNDTLMARITPCLENGKTAYVDILEYDEVAFGSTEFFVLRSKEGKSDSKFIYYLTISEEFRKVAIQSMTGTSGRQRAQKDSLLNYELSVPILKEQKKIGKILSLYDEKVESNNAIISNLEELAQTLFKRWFVDFEFPNEEGKPYKSSGGKMVESELGMIPKGWAAGTLADVGEIVGGGTPSKKVPDYYSVSEISWLTPKDLSTNKSVFQYKGVNDISELGLKKSSARLLPENTVLYSSRAPIGYTAIAGKKLATNQGFKSIIPSEKYSSEYVYFLLKHLTPVIEANAGGSTFKEISAAGMKRVKTILPLHLIVKQYGQIVNCIFNEIKRAEKENSILKKTHDALLPKLLSGEIELPDDMEVTDDVPIS